MSTFDTFHFLRPFWLLLVPVTVYAWWALRRAGDSLSGWRTIVEPELLDAMTAGEETVSYWRENTLLGIWVLGLVALAGPTWKPEPSPFADDPVPVMLVMQASESMSESDLSPSRLERAQLKIKDFATARNGQPLGLVAYAGSSHLVLPPTRDTAIVADFASEISHEIMPKPGERLTPALELSAAALDSASGSLVVVMSDAAISETMELSQFRASSETPIHIFAIARTNTPEYERIQTVAQSLKADVQLLSPDTSDIDALVRKCASTPLRVASREGSVRWAESGWWLLPGVAVFVLLNFRREDDGPEVPT